jgi:CelD/BcsL family acetyltransferase involved in cellulose biosynthesis
MVAAARGDVHVGVLERDGIQFGFFPFQRGRLGTGQPVGWTLSDYQGAVVERDAAWDAKELIHACGLKTWEFDHVIAQQAQFGPFGTVRRESPVMDVSQGFEAYLQERRDAGGSEIATALRKMRKLGREHGELEFEPHARAADTLELLMRWKSEQYRRTGAADVLARPWVRHVIELAHATEGESFAGPLSVLRAGDRIVAVHLGLRSSTTWHYWFPAYDPQLARYSPGLALLLKMAEHAPSVGVRSIDLGKGDARYKRNLMSGAVPLLEGRVELPSLAAAAGRLRHGARALARRTSAGAPLRRIVTRATRRG